MDIIEHDKKILLTEVSLFPYCFFYPETCLLSENHFTIYGKLGNWENTRPVILSDKKSEVTCIIELKIRTCYIQHYTWKNIYLENREANSRKY